MKKENIIQYAGYKKVKANAQQLKRRKGEYYERWLVGMSLWLTRMQSDKQFCTPVTQKHHKDTAKKHARSQKNKTRYDRKQADVPK